MEAPNKYFLRWRYGQWELHQLHRPLRHPHQTQTPIFASEKINECWRFLKFRELELGKKLRLVRAH